MGSWGSGPGMIQEPELEEGEACYYKDDTSIDPDIALSYIGDKVQSILGHFQKDFEGGVSAENLGAKYGGYGSFLPTYQRSPSIRTQPKSPQRDQNPSTPRSPDHLLPEATPHNSVVLPDAPSSQRNSAAAPPTMRALDNLKVPSGCPPVRQDISSETFSGRRGLASNKSDNSKDLRTLKVRIKVGSDKAAQKNAEIYSGLGLMSPPSSAGNSPEESGRRPFKSQETPDKSPASILRTMTFFPVSGGLLLSPLQEDLLNLIGERRSSIKSESADAPRGRQSHSAVVVDDSTSRLGNGNASREKKTKSLGKNKNSERSKTEGPTGATGNIGELETDAQGKKRELNKNRVKVKPLLNNLARDGLSEPRPRQSGRKCDREKVKNRSDVKMGDDRCGSSQNEVSFDHEESSRSKGNKIHASFKVDSDASDGEMVSRATGDHLIEKHGTKASFMEQDEIRMHNPVKKLLLEDKRKSKGSQTSGKLAQESPGAVVSTTRTDKKSNRKNAHGVYNSHKDTMETKLENMDNLNQFHGRPSGDRSKDFNFDDVKENVMHSNKSKEKANSEKLNSTDAVPSAKGPSTDAAQATEVPVLLNDNWVQCDRCSRWRLLPFGSRPEMLPEKWLCSMLTWLPGMNRCDYSEEETTRAFEALYHATAPENHHNLQTHVTTSGIASATVHHFNQNPQHIAPDPLADQGRKKHKLKETPNAGGNEGPPLASGLKKKAQHQVVRSRSTKEVNQVQAETNVTVKTNSQQLSKPLANLVKHSNKRKEDHLIEGDAYPRKKSKRESDEKLPGSMKKIKPEGALGIDYPQNFGRNPGRVTSGLPNKSALKDKKTQNLNSNFEDAVPGQRDNLQISLKKQNYDARELPDHGFLELEAYNRRQVSVKKRKVKVDHSGESSKEMLQNNVSDLHGGNLSVTEEHSDSSLCREKRLKVGPLKGKDSVTGKGDIQKREDAGTRIKLPGNRENSVDWRIEKENQYKKFRAKLPMQLTMEDIENLRKDLGSGQVSVAATSSSSKVSDSRKTRPNYKEVKDSPEESVSSSPMRMPHPSKVSPMRLDDGRELDARFGDFPATGRSAKSLNGKGNSESSLLKAARKGKTAAVRHPESFENPVLDFRDSAGRDKLHGKHQFGSKPAEFSNGAGVGSNGVLEENSPCPISIKFSGHSHGKERTSKNHSNTSLPQPNTRKGASDESSLRSSRDQRNAGERNPEKWGDGRRENVSRLMECNRSALCSLDTLEQNTEQELETGCVSKSSILLESRNRKLQDNHFQGNVQDAFACSNNPTNASVAGDVQNRLKRMVNPCHPNGSLSFGGHMAGDPSLARDLSARSPANKDGSHMTASSALKDAEKSRDYADRLKNSGFDFECNEAYFEAALKFLHGASLLEANNGESSKHGEMNQIQIYSSTAKLCETCAHEYEKRREMAAAALAYKCKEVAYMRVVYCKNSSASRVWLDLQASLQMAPQGESPSSSASDIDNLNHLPNGDKATFSKGNGSLAGARVIAPQNCQNFIRLLDFTKDVNSAMEASMKSHSALAAATSMLEETQNKEAIASLKKVIEFSFQDIDEFIHLVQVACKAINRQGFSGARE